MKFGNQVLFNAQKWHPCCDFFRAICPRHFFCHFFSLVFAHIRTGTITLPKKSLDSESASIQIRSKNICWVKIFEIVSFPLTETQLPTKHYSRFSKNTYYNIHFFEFLDFLLVLALGLHHKASYHVPYNYLADSGTDILNKTHSRHFVRFSNILLMT